MKNLTLKEISRGLENKEFSALELAKEYLKRIKKQDKKINSFVTVTQDLALKQAREADRIIREKGKVSVLTGAPIAVKDNILVKGEKTTCSSKMLKDYTAPFDAFAIKKLKDLGVVILGKTNLDEFAMGASTENSAFFATKNPYDLTRVPGGSSGGSAAAVADDFCCCALGSDAGGSIRQPAAFCSVVGLKPTYGAVSRFGLVAFASSLDQIGPITKNVDDAQTLFNAIKGKDEKDSTSIEYEIQDSKFRIQDLRIGVPKEYFVKGMDQGVKDLVQKKIKELEGKGAKIQEISLAHTKYAIAAYYLTATSEASANLARYDGVKYGLSKAQDNLMETYLKTKSAGFGPEVKRRIMLGTYSLSAGYYDAFYLKAQKVRALIKKDFDLAFKKTDVILTPTTPTPAFKIGEKSEDPLAMYLSDIYTVSVNLAGLPAVSVPVGFLGKLPVGLQLIGKPFEESNLLKVAGLCQE